MEKKLVSGKEFADIVGISSAAVSKMRSSGKLVLESSKINLYKSILQLSKTSDLSRSKVDWSKHLPAGSGSKSLSPSSSSESENSDSAGSPQSFDLNYERAREQHYRAEAAEMDHHEKIGTLTRTEQVSADAFECARQTQKNILAIPDRISSELAVMQDADEIAELLLKELSSALLLVSNILSKQINQEEEQCFAS